MKILSAIRIVTVAALVSVCELAACAQQFSAGELIDPATGARWVLLRDTAHPDAPGRWVLAHAGEVGKTSSRAQSAVIRAGDRIVLVEHSAIADARLAAFALTSAAKGETLRVRIAIGGAVVMARADGKGLAEIAPAETGPSQTASTQAGIAEAW
jgi:hypothetical protein